MKRIVGLIIVVALWRRLQKFAAGLRSILGSHHRSTTRHCHASAGPTVLCCACQPLQRHSTHGHSAARSKHGAGVAARRRSAEFRPRACRRNVVQLHAERIANADAARSDRRACSRHPPLCRPVTPDQWPAPRVRQQFDQTTVHRVAPPIQIHKPAWHRNMRRTAIRHTNLGTAKLSAAAHGCTIAWQQWHSHPRHTLGARRTKLCARHIWQRHKHSGSGKQFQHPYDDVPRSIIDAHSHRRAIGLHVRAKYHQQHHTARFIPTRRHKFVASQQQSVSADNDSIVGQCSCRKFIHRKPIISGSNRRQRPHSRNHRSAPRRYTH